MTDTILSSILVLLGIACIITTVYLHGLSRVGRLFLAYVALVVLSILLPFVMPVLNDWIRHGLFYCSQVVNMLLLGAIVQREHSKRLPDKPKSAQLPVILFAQIGVGRFITQEGVQHLLAVPFMLALATQITLNYGYLRTAWWRAVLYLTLYSAVFFTLSHMAEFVLEAQGIGGPALMAKVDLIEFVCNLMGLCLLMALIVVSGRRRGAAKS